QLLEAQAVRLRVAVRAERESFHQLPPEMTATSLREKSVFAEQLDARLVLVRGFAVAAYAHVAGRYAAHAALLVEQQLRRGEARVDLDSQRFGLLPHPAANVAEADDVVPVVAEAFGQEGAGNLERPRFAEKQEAVLG